MSKPLPKVSKCRIGRREWMVGYETLVHATGLRLLYHPWRRSDLIVAFSFQRSECETSRGCHIGRFLSPPPPAVRHLETPFRGESRPPTSSRACTYPCITTRKEGGRMIGEGVRLERPLPLPCTRARLGMWRTLFSRDWIVDLPRGSGCPRARFSVP